MKGKGNSFSGIILAGGRNSRMGVNKAFLEIAGLRMIDKILHLYREIFSEVIIAVNDVRAFQEFGNACIVADLYRNKGALGGLYTGLFFATNPYSFVAACDMPFLNKSFILHLLELSGDHDIVVPKTAKGFQPLHAVYSRRCLPVMRKHILDDKFKISGFYQNLSVLTVAEEDINNFGDSDSLFLNINTEEDLKKIYSHTK